MFVKPFCIQLRVGNIPVSICVRAYYINPCVDYLLVFNMLFLFMFTLLHNARGNQISQSKV